MKRLKVEGELTTGGRDGVLFGSNITVKGYEDKLVKKMTLHMEAGEPTMLEIEEYVVEPLAESPDQAILTVKTSHLVNFIDIETVGEVDRSSEDADLEAIEFQKLVDEKNENFISAIDDLEI